MYVTGFPKIRFDFLMSGNDNQPVPTITATCYSSGLFLFSPKEIFAFLSLQRCVGSLNPSYMIESLYILIKFRQINDDNLVITAVYLMGFKHELVFDFDNDLYNKIIQVGLLAFLRTDKALNSLNRRIATC